MTEDKKITYIVSDFVQNFIEKIGPMPDNISTADSWINQVFIPAGDKWMLKYKNNSMYSFAKKIALAYMDIVDKQYREMLNGETMSINEYLENNNT